MFCPNCGAQLPEGSVFCTNCGAKLAEPQQQPQQQYQQPQQPQQQYQQQQQPYQQPQGGGYPQQPQQYQQPVYSSLQNAGGDPRYKGFPMGWHKFLCYFALWASALLNVITGISVMSGSQYGGSYEKELVYRVFSSMKTADTLYGLIILASGILAAVTAFFLLKLKKNGPTLLTVIYVLVAAGSLLYTFMVINALSGTGTDTSELTAQAIMQLVVSVIMIIVNRIYYNKRSSLFVN